MKNRILACFAAIAVAAISVHAIHAQSTPQITTAPNTTTAASAQIGNAESAYTLPNVSLTTTGTYGIFNHQSATTGPEFIPEKVIVETNGQNGASGSAILTLSGTAGTAIVTGTEAANSASGTANSIAINNAAVPVIYPGDELFLNITSAATSGTAPFTANITVKGFYR